MRNKGLTTGTAATLLMIATACSPTAPETELADDLVDDDLVSVHQWVNPSPDVTPTRTPDRGQLDSVDDMLAGLEARLEREPDDVKGWSLLAQSYAYVGRMSDADAAVDCAVALGADRASLERRVLTAHGEGS